MKKKVPGVLVGLVAAVALTAAPADAANVTIRVEGTGQTLVPRTAASTSATPVGKDGRNCPGTSALAPLDQATGGAWGGTYYPDFQSWFVETIKGETHNSSAQGYWALWVNDTYSTQGICGATLQEGDRVLIVPDNAGPVLELAGVPATAAPGQAVTVRVTEYSVADPLGSAGTVSKPAAGTTVTYGGATATTGADGNAVLTFAGAGPAAVQATQAGRVRSATETTCVTSGSDGACGSPAPAAPCATSGHDGRCGTRDTEAPRPSIAGLEMGQKFRRTRAPRQLRGTVAPDPSGLRQVKLSITRKVGKRCWFFSGRSERFRRHRCARAVYFALGDRADWSYLLPRRLARGRYTIRVAAIDEAFNRAEDKVVIRVR